MADDEDKKDKEQVEKDNTPNKKDDVQVEKDNTSNKKDDAQIKNELNTIKAQLTATNKPAELARLAGLAAGLKSSTNNPQLIEQIQNLQTTISKKEENAEHTVSSTITAENLEAQRQAQTQTQTPTPEAVREQELNERHESLKAQHPKIMQDADELIEKKKKHNENLESVLDDLKNGRDISPEKLKACIKTPEQIQEEKDKEKALRDHQKQATAHYQELEVEKDRLEKRQAILIKQAEEQRKINEKLPPHELAQGQHKLVGIEDEIQQTKVRLETIKPQIDDTKKVKDDADKKVEKDETENKKRQEYQKQIKEEIDKQKEKNPQHTNLAAFDSFSALLLNQTNAVETSEIKDRELRNKNLGVKDNKEPEIKFPGQESVPEIILPGKEKLPPEQKLVVAETSATTSHKLGEESLELADNRPVPKDKSHNHASKMQTSFAKQPSSVNTGEESQANNLARANQQNKKNDKGHSR